jgi:hypothetical protein
MGVSNTPDICFNLAALFPRVEGLEEVSLPFTKEEIDNVIKSIPTDKAPSPDGFNGMFLKVCWDILAPDFYKLCDDFREGKISLHCLNSSFITLVPKKLTHESVNDYRPISLLNYVLKVLTKIIAMRLQKWTLKLVHRNQYGFIKGRNIQDCLAWSFEYLYMNAKLLGMKLLFSNLILRRRLTPWNTPQLFRFLLIWALMIDSLIGLSLS